MALTCMVAGLTVARLLLVVLFKKIKQETVLRASLITAAIGFALLTFSPDFARAAIGMVLVGAGWHLLSPSYSALSAAGTLLCRERHSVWPLL